MKRSGFGILCADFFLAALILVMSVCVVRDSGEDLTESTDADQSVYIRDYTVLQIPGGIREFRLSRDDILKGSLRQTVKIAAEVQEKKQEKKQVAITFDDGPDPVYTPELLTGLKERNVKATFFLLGKQVEQYPDIVKQMYEEGHVIGCHSYEHVDLSQLSEEDACAQVKQICDLIYGITGERPSFVRPPYGEWLSCLDEDFCMIPVLWDVDPLDWATGDARLVTNRVLEDVEEYDIILMHDASESSVEAALGIIDVLQGDGYEFVTVDELILP